MFAFIQGTVVEVDIDSIVLENNGIGYRIYMPVPSFEGFLSIGENTKVYTVLSVREDGMSLYGFRTKDELYIYKLLIGISGIGPKAAISILSSVPSGEFKMAVVMGDDKKLSKAPGIGKKSAQRIVLELKDKFDINDFAGLSDGMEEIVPAEETKVPSETVEALCALGYGRQEALAAVRQAKITEGMDVEDALRKALSELSIL